MNASHSLKRWQEGSGLDPHVSPSGLHQSGWTEGSAAAPEGLVQGRAVGTGKASCRERCCPQSTCWNAVPNLN